MSVHRSSSSHTNCSHIQLFIAFWLVSSETIDTCDKQLARETTRSPAFYITVVLKTCFAYKKSLLESQLFTTIFFIMFTVHTFRDFLNFSNFRRRAFFPDMILFYIFFSLLHQPVYRLFFGHTFKGRRPLSQDTRPIKTKLFLYLLEKGQSFQF